MQTQTSVSVSATGIKNISDNGSKRRQTTTPTWMISNKLLLSIELNSYAVVAAAAAK